MNLRRLGLTLGCALACSQSLALANELSSTDASVSRWEFAVLLNGKEIGEHRFERIETEGAVQVRSDASFDVKVLFINAYRYRHNSTERWQDGCLASLQATTDRNGDQISVSADAGVDGVVVAGKAGEQTIGDACVMTFAYWNPAILEQDALLNSQTGAYQPIRVTHAGADSIRAAGQSIAANRYEVDTGQGRDQTLVSPERRSLACA